MTIDTPAADYELVLDPDNLLARPGHLLRATLRLPPRAGQDEPTEVPVTLGIEYTHDQKARVSAFALQSVAAFAGQFDAVLDYVADQARQEAAAYAEAFGREAFDPASGPARPEGASGVGVGGVGAVVTEVFFGRKQVPSDESVKKMKELLYPELTEDQIRAIHDRPETRSTFDVKATVPWDEEHIRLFRFRDGQCVERAAT